MVVLSRASYARSVSRASCSAAFSVEVVVSFSISGYAVRLEERSGNPSFMAAFTMVTCMGSPASQAEDLTERAVSKLFCSLH